MISVPIMMVLVIIMVICVMLMRVDSQLLEGTCCASGACFGCFCAGMGFS